MLMTSSGGAMTGSGGQSRREGEGVQPRRAGSEFQGVRRVVRGRLMLIAFGVTAP